jgi:hypothetical protein
VQTENRKVDWEQVKRCLFLIDKTSKDFLRQALIIGGAGCLFYRHQLFKANDPDFQIPPSSPEEEKRWLSRDIDVTGIFSEDAFLMLPHFVEVHDGNKYMVVDGVRFGFVQAGVTIDPEEAIENAWVANITVDGKTVEFLVADPVTLFFEKLKLCAQRGNKNDFLHRDLLFNFIAYDLTRGAERLLQDPLLPIVESKNILQNWHKVKNKTPEILQNKRLRNRVEPLCAKSPNHPIARYLAEA